MKVVSVDPQAPRADRVRPAVEVLQAAGLVALPTETFYGIAADAASPEALLKVNRLKGKADDSPILLLVADAAQVETVAAALPPIFHTLVDRFWPGPLTLVVRAAPGLPVDVSGRRGTVAVRAPGLPLPRRLARDLGRPIAGVSANLHGHAPCRTAREVVEQLGEGLDLVLDGGSTAGGQPSTILDLTGDAPAVLRHGLLPASALEPFLPGLGERSL